MNCFDKALYCLLSSVFLLVQPVHAQHHQQADSKPVWEPDLGNGRYRNPIIHADYSDPDVIRVGKHYYMTASSFNSAPGLPLLQSEDMIHWRIVGHALPNLMPAENFRTPQHGKGVWAPSLRFHDGKFWIFYPDPDFGIYVMTAKEFAGPWSTPHLLVAGKGLIDPTPLWDEDGKAWLLHAWAKSRAGFNNQLTLRAMAPDASKLLDDEGTLVVDGNQLPGYKTLEGPKLYKRNAWYYIFAPAGGVEFGWQSVFRAKNILGPYEEKIVLAQGDSKTNGPHQGAWVTAEDGRDWFYHFQDKRAYGRIVHLQPMQWKDDWPVMGKMHPTTGIGEPVDTWEKPVLESHLTNLANPPSSDDFSSPTLGLQWQWNANWNSDWYSLTANRNHLRLYPQALTASALASSPLIDYPAILLQKLPAPAFNASVKLKLNTHINGDRAGLVLYGLHYAWIGVEKHQDHYLLQYRTCTSANLNLRCQEKIVHSKIIKRAEIHLKIALNSAGMAQFYYSEQGEHFTAFDTEFNAAPGRWVGAKVGLFHMSTSDVASSTLVDNTNSNQAKSTNRFADFADFRMRPKTND
ncbi:glycoside hydrolase family 43 protein [Undibacterium fentianense]|uniref:Glycoside hydrolase 43 family protein n=1 Tax=Undibacterium fentianense TaxID=2828728 RepID=A0A941DY08_9BURK|nr:glycoside hydrolase 43 family protein [Undibacterium fentianense]MBR7799524.1 glycoside hydrolase 43 family protein [Undibacterium fentianense]